MSSNTPGTPTPPRHGKRQAAPSWALTALLAGLLLASTLATAACGGPAPVVFTSPLVDTRDTLGPYPIRAQVRDLEASALTLYYRVEGFEGLGEVAGEPLGQGEWELRLPGQAASSRVHWYLVAFDADGAPAAWAPSSAEGGDLACLQGPDSGEIPPGGAAFCFSVLR